MRRRTFIFTFLILFTCSSLLFAKDVKAKDSKTKQAGKDYETLIFLDYGVTFSYNGFLNGTGYNSVTLGGISAKTTLIRGYLFGAFFQVGYFLPTGISSIDGQNEAVDKIFSSEIRGGAETSFGITFRYEAQPFVLYVGLGPHVGLAVKNFDNFLNFGVGSFGRFTFTLTKKIRVNIGADISYNFIGTGTSADVAGTFVHNVTGSLTTGWIYTF